MTENLVTFAERYDLVMSEVLGGLAAATATRYIKVRRRTWL
jgi:hypothetical protein